MRDTQLERPGEPGRILAVRLDNIGDVVMLTPALRALRRAFPAAHLALLASPAGASAAPLLPWVDEVRVLRALWQQLDPGPEWTPESELAAVADLRSASYDAAYLFTSFSQSPHPAASFCHLAGIPVRVGQSKEFGGGVLTTWVRPGPDDQHQVDRNLHLLDDLGIPLAGDHLELHVPDGAARAAVRLLARAGLPAGRPYAVLAPGASASSRRWPAERFAALARHLEADLDLVTVVVGGPSDRERAASIAARAGPGAVVVAGETSVPELAAVVQGSTVVVTNNSAPMHLADAFGRPVVVPFAGTELESQWQPRHTAARLLRRPTPCAPCYSFACPYDNECLDLDPAEVAAAVVDVLSPSAVSGAAPRGGSTNNP